MKPTQILATGLLSVIVVISASLATAAEPTTHSPNPKNTSMKITTFYATDTGESRFRDVEIPLAQQRDDGFGHTLVLSNPYASPNVQFVELPAGLDQDWHNAPARQVVMVLDGVIEVETTDGERRQWRNGEAFLPADVTGRGHRTRCVGGPVRLLFAPLPEGFDINAWSN